MPHTIEQAIDVYLDLQGLSSNLVAALKMTDRVKRNRELLQTSSFNSLRDRDATLANVLLALQDIATSSSDDRARVDIVGSPVSVVVSMVGEGNAYEVRQVGDGYHLEDWGPGIFRRVSTGVRGVYLSQEIA